MHTCRMAITPWEVCTATAMPRPTPSPSVEAMARAHTTTSVATTAEESMCTKAFGLHLRSPCSHTLEIRQNYRNNCSHVTVSVRFTLHSHPLLLQQLDLAPVCGWCCLFVEVKTMIMHQKNVWSVIVFSVLGGIAPIASFGR